MVKLKIGDKAPNFKVKNQEGILKSLKDYGDLVVLYFYPQDNTPGCTSEACSLTDGYKKLQERRVAIIGVSPDSIESHQKFIKKYNIPFDLLADEKKEILKAYGAWQEKNMYGRKYMGVVRKTFLIKEGKIKHIFNKVNVKEHADQIIEQI